MTPCLTITGIKSSGENFRPATKVPSKHWAFMFSDAMMKWDCHFQGKLPHRGTLPEGIRVAYRKDDIVIEVDERFKDDNPEGFAQLMRLVRGYDLVYELAGRCGECTNKHPDCVGTMNDANQ